MQIVEYRIGKKNNYSKEHLMNLMKKINYIQENYKGIRLSEVICPDRSLFYGPHIFNVLEPIKIYKYTLSNEVQTHRNFIAIKMPCKKYDRFFDSLSMDIKLKIKPLAYFYKVLCFYKSRCSLSIFDINKTVLFYGKPGTGKTTLAKSIFQRFSIRIKRECLFVEINCSKLFSKYYGETTRVLSDISNEILELSKNKVILVLIDEVESILINRELSLSNQEPLESVRIVNTFLLFLDHCKTNKHIYLSFTTNFMNNLDPAFIDRCDIQIHLDVLDNKNIYCLLKKIIERLMVKSIIRFVKIYDYDDISDPDVNNESKELLDISKLFNGFSTRKIKKIFFEYVFFGHKNCLELILRRIKEDYNK